MKTKRLNRQLMHNLLGIFNKYINEDWCHYNISKGPGYISYDIFIFGGTKISDSCIIYSEVIQFVDDANFEEKKKHIEELLKYYSDESIRSNKSS